MTDPGMQGIDAPAEVVARIRETEGKGARVMVAVAGPPGAGKSTVSAALARALPEAAILPMDGFHLDNETLRARDLFARKGAPETFDVSGLRALLERVRAGGEVRVPTFDRAADCVVPGGDVIPEAASIVIVEGNYLLLDEEGWRALHPFWDLTVMIDVPEDVLERRLVQRWLDHGLAPEAALARARQNDLPNAARVRTASVTADLVWRQ